MKSAITITFHSLMAALATSVMAQDTTATTSQKLPFVQDFQPARYLGKWYEVARLPTPIQPSDTLAIAEYSAGEEAGQVIVKNSAFDKTGRKLSDIKGQAKLADGNPPGRLLVAFGPSLPTRPNYHVLHVDKDYRYAVVGVPDRKSLWILAREVPISKETFVSLREIAQKSGIDVSKLILAPWDKIPKNHEAEPDGAANGSQPSPANANQTPSAAGSRR
ncbi:MAG: lipocalin family protein [Pirellula sp.]